MNKRGGEKLFSIWWFFVISLVGVGIIAGVSLFYSNDSDVREIETKILYERIMDCLIEPNGIIVNSFFNNDFDIYKKCNLDKEIFDSKGNFYFNISIFSSDKSVIKSLYAGNAGFESDCNVVKKTPGKYYPVCFRNNDTILYFDHGIKSAKIEILIAFNNERKVLN